MTKMRSTAPSFLVKKLDDKMFKVVKGHVSTFIREVAKKKDGSQTSTIELVHQFIEYLAKHERAFRSLDPNVLNTSQAGTN